jgi:uncharacterized membrane protein
MHWSRLLGALAVATVAFVAVGALVGLVGTVFGSNPALAVVALLVVAVAAASRMGASPNRVLSNPYWG